MRLLLIERVFDVAGTAKAAFAHVVRFAVLLVVLIPILYGAAALMWPVHESRWPLAVTTVVLVCPLAAACDWMTKRLMGSFSSQAESVAREKAMEVLRTATSQDVVAKEVELLAKHCLGGLDVLIRLDDGSPSTAADDLEANLVRMVRRRWLSPETAVRQLRGAELDRVLEGFIRGRLGAIVKYTGRRVSVLVFVQQRGGGSKPIVSRELEFLYELATVVGTSIDRLRAIEDSVRAQRLATIGRVAADYSHSARNQISAILALVEAVKDGEENQLSRAYREAVYAETISLASNHNMASEITRLGSNRLTIKRCPVRPLLQSVTMTWAKIAAKANGRMELQLPEAEVMVQADEDVLRQVLTNLLRNAVQACAAASTAPIITVSAQVARDAVRIEVADNGPGVSPELHDRLFTPWSTTKPDGTGLGLSFCYRAMQALAGDITYAAPRGAAHARFRLRLPTSPAALVQAPVNLATIA